LVSTIRSHLSDGCTCICIRITKRNDEFELDGYESILVPRVESINNSSKRGHGGIALFYKKHLKPGIITVDIDPSGFICVKLFKLYFQLYV